MLQVDATAINPDGTSGLASATNSALSMPQKRGNFLSCSVAALASLKVPSGLQDVAN